MTTSFSDLRSAAWELKTFGRGMLTLMATFLAVMFTVIFLSYGDFRLHFYLIRPALGWILLSLVLIFAVTLPWGLRILFRGKGEVRLSVDLGGKKTLVLKVQGQEFRLHPPFRSELYAFEVKAYKMPKQKFYFLLLYDDFDKPLAIFKEGISSLARFSPHARLADEKTFADVPSVPEYQLWRLQSRPFLEELYDALQEGKQP